MFSCRLASKGLLWGGNVNRAQRSMAGSHPEHRLGTEGPLAWLPEFLLGRGKEEPSAIVLS